MKPHLSLPLVAFLGLFLLLSGVGSSTAAGSSPASSLAQVDLDSSACGRTVLIPDGEDDSLYIHARCTESSPLRVRAQNDGKALFNGHGSGKPCQIVDSSWVYVEGIVCHHSSDMVVNISQSDHVHLSRVSAYQAGPEYGDHVFEVYRSDHITVEDCAASGRGRNMYIAYESDNVTFRRCWGRVTDPPYCSADVGRCADWMQIYGSADSTIENCIGIRAGDLSDPYMNVNQYWYATWNRDEDRVDRNRTIGSVFYGHDYHGLNVISANQQLHGNSVENSVFIGNDNPSLGWGVPYTGIFQRVDDQFRMDHLTLVNHQYGVSLTHDSHNPWFDIQGTLTNSSILSSSVGVNLAHYSEIDVSLDHRYNNFHDVDSPYSGTSAGEGETSVNPAYDTAKYGMGAYLLVPPPLRGAGERGTDVGAEVLFQSEEGQITTNPLWPWPMEDRVCAETTRLLGEGISVTYESHQSQYDYDHDGQPETYDCGGGIWRTLEGVYAPAPNPTPTPAPPTFADVPSSHPYYRDIEALYHAGYTAGCNTSPLMYCPEATMNRAESAVFVERGIRGTDGLPPQPASQTFADLPLDSWAAKWAEALWQDGYTAGCGTDPLVFCPWQGHTRAEGCVFYLRMLNGPDYTPPQPAEQIFADVPLETWYAKWVQPAYEAGLIPACGEAPLRFCPDDPLTRGLAAHMMVGAKQIPLP